MMVPILLTATMAGAAANEAGEHFAAGDDTGARAMVVETLRRAPDDASAHYLLGRLEYRRRDWQAAVEHAQRAVQLRPDDSEYCFRLSLALSRYIDTVGVLGKPAVAVRIRDNLQHAVALSPDFLDARNALMKYQLSAPAFLGGGLAKARAGAAEIARRSALEGRLAEAEIADHEDQSEIASAGYREVLRLAPAHHNAAAELGALYRRLGRYDEAFEMSQRALRANPHNTSEQFALGLASDLVGRHLEDGLAAVQTFLHDSPKDDDDPPPAEAHLLLGTLQRKLGHRDEARAEYRAALALDADLEAAKTALRALD